MNNTSFENNKLNTRKVVHAKTRLIIKEENIKHYHQEKKKDLKDTRNLLTISFVSIFFCLFALTGTTYAWFSATVSNSNNRIQAGNLDVGLLAENSSSGEIIDLSNDEATVFSVTSLTPDKPVETILTVKNKGTVDLRFAVFFDIKEDEANLSSVLKVYVKEIVSGIEDNKPDNPVGTIANCATTSGFISGDISTDEPQKQYHIWIELDSSASLETYKGKQIKFDICLRAKQIEDSSALLEND